MIMIVTRIIITTKIIMTLVTTTKTVKLFWIEKRSRLSEGWATSIASSTSWRIRQSRTNVETDGQLVTGCWPIVNLKRRSMMVIRLTFYVIFYSIVLFVFWSRESGLMYWISGVPRNKDGRLGGCFTSPIVKLKVRLYFFSSYAMKANYFTILREIFSNVITCVWVTKTGVLGKRFRTKRTECFAASLTERDFRPQPHVKFHNPIGMFRSHFERIMHFFNVFGASCQACQFAVWFKRDKQFRFVSTHV